MKRDANGGPIPTYTGDDVSTFARAWTGFNQRSNRAGYEYKRAVNLLDSMHVTSEGRFRDVFPKTDLHGGYIGDGYPLCSDMPPRMFLREGALYRYLGSTSSPRGTNVEGNTPSTVRRLAPEPGHSALYNALCHNSTCATALCQQNVNCVFPQKVVLPATIPCRGVECGLETVRTVKVVSQNGQTRYYEYVRPPCVTFAYYRNAKVVQQASARSKPKRSANGQMCADPLTATAGVVCEKTAPLNQSPVGSAEEDCAFAGELVTFAKAQERCLNKTMYRFDDTKKQTHRLWPGAAGYSFSASWQCKYYYIPAWINHPCILWAQVSKTGSVNIVHNTPGAISGGKGGVFKDYGNSSGNEFTVPWRDGAYPAVATSKCSGACFPHHDSCMCGVSVDTVAVFTDAAAVPSQKQVEASLRIGAFPANAHDAGVYTRCTTSACVAATGIEVYTRGTATTPVLDVRALFKVIKGTRTRRVEWFANKLSTVKVRSRENRPVIELRHPADASDASSTKIHHEP